MLVGLSVGEFVEVGLCVLVGDHVGVIVGVLVLVLVSVGVGLCV